MKSIHEKDYQILIDRLRGIRSEVRLGQNEVGKQMGWVKSMMSKVETYERRLDVMEFFELLLIYDVPLKRILTDTKYEVLLPKKDQNPE